MTDELNGLSLPPHTLRPYSQYAFLIRIIIN